MRGVGKIISFFSGLMQAVWQVLFIDAKSRYASTKESIDESPSCSAKPLNDDF